MELRSLDEYMRSPFGGCSESEGKSFGQCPPLSKSLSMNLNSGLFTAKIHVTRVSCSYKEEGGDSSS